MEEKAPNILDKLGENQRAKFDNNLARVIACSLENHVEDRFQTVDDMHEAVYSCLVERGEASYRYDS